nr:hypothetical protein B0A51_15348 [Rachicladosporium sp. CCFEE 5018]
MISSWPFAALLSVATALALHSNAQQQLASPAPLEEEMPTIYESTIMARRILSQSSEGTLVTVFPSETESDDLSTSENRPKGMAGSPIGLMEYFADCDSTGNPTILAIGIATPFRNYVAGSNISLSVRWWPSQTHIYSTTEDENIPTPHTPAALPRFSLHGYLEDVDFRDYRNYRVPACFLAKHPDSVLWQPGNDVHTSKYVRLVVEHVYWFGGFGDRARIGWLPMEDWRRVTKGEIDRMRLPGEK